MVWNEHAPNTPLNSDPARNVFRSFSSSHFLGFVQHLGAVGTCLLHSLGLMLDIAKIVRRMHAISSSFKGEPLRVTLPGADDQTVWKFNQPPSALVIQLESPDGMCPFLIESGPNNPRFVGSSVPEVIDILCQLLPLRSSSA